MNEDYILFASVIEQGSISAAARALGLSPAMASRRLAQLETRLGARLIHRTTRKQSPTEVGQQFYGRIVDILAASAEAERLVTSEASAPIGSVRITAPTSFGRRHLAPHLAGFLRDHPRIHLRLDLSDDYVDLIARRYDVAIRIARQIDGAMAHVRLAPNHRVLCASPTYLAEHGEPMTLSALKSHHLLAADGQSPWRLESPDGPVTIGIEARLETNSSEVVRELVVAGGGIALRSIWDIHRELDDGALRAILPEFRGGAGFAIFAVHPAPVITSPAVKAFVAYIERLYASPPWEPAITEADSTP